uniref:Uncharacterized protein n=1 Tax=Lutzomyia longipalpis TaxID=7200 RepID=A0A1B0CX63_LUTLO
MKKWSASKITAIQNLSCASQRSKNAGTAHQYVPRKGAAASTVAKTAGRYTTFTLNIVCVSHVKSPWKRAIFAVAAITPAIEPSIASAILGPDLKPRDVTKTRESMTSLSIPTLLLAHAMMPSLAAGLSTISSKDSRIPKPIFGPITSSPLRSRTFCTRRSHVFCRLLLIRVLEDVINVRFNGIPPIFMGIVDDVIKGTFREHIFELGSVDEGLLNYLVPKLRYGNSL